MKKKLILLMLVSVVMMCLLAISVSATEINKDTTVTLSGSFTMGEESVNNPVVNLYDAEGYALVWYLNTDKKLVSDRAVNLITVTDNKAKFNDVSKFYGGSQQKGVVVVNLRDDFVKDGISGIEKFDSNFQFGYYSAKKSSPIQYFYFPKTATEIIDRMFQDTQVMIADIEPGTPITYMGLHAVTQSNLKEFFVPKGIPNFIEHDNVGVFEGTQLEKITFEEGSQITIIPYRCFYLCSELKEVILPNSVEEIHYRAFQLTLWDSKAKLEKLVLGASFKGFKGTTGDNFYVRGAANVKVYFPATFIAENVEVSSAHQYFTLCPNATFYYCGTEAQWDALIAKISQGKNGATGNDSGENIITAKANDKVSFNVNPCDTFYKSVHNHVGTGDCMDGLACNRCADKVAGTTAHTYYETLIYASFASNGIYDYGCSNEGCTKYDVYDDKVAPIFVAKGYSNSDNGIAGGYTVNIAQYNEYVRVNGKEITFGVLMLNPKYLDGKDSFFNGTNVNIDGTKGYVKVDMTNLSYKDFTYSITGFGADSKDVDLVVCAFAYVDGEDVEFIQDQTTKCASKKVTKNDATLYTVTFNTVEAKAGNVIANLGEYTVPEKED